MRAAVFFELIAVSIFSFNVSSDVVGDGEGEAGLGDGKGEAACGEGEVVESWAINF